MTTIIIPLQEFPDNRMHRLRNLSKIAVEKGLQFSTLDDVGLNMIAIDCVKRKVLFLKYAPGHATCLMVDVSKLQDCTINTQYRCIPAGSLTKRKISDFLKSIFLNLRFRNGAIPVTLPIYDERTDTLDDLEQLEAKAKKWHTMFTQLLKPLRPGVKQN